VRRATKLLGMNVVRAVDSILTWRGYLLIAIACAGMPARAAPGAPQVPAPDLEPSHLSVHLSVKPNIPESERPFWRRNKAVAKRIREERAIVVSVRRDEASDRIIHLAMSGAGQVSKPKDFCFEVGQQFEQLPLISDHFKKVIYDAPNRRVFMIVQALGYQARMLLNLEMVSEDWRSEIQFEIVWGQFKGMKGVVGFEKISENKTEISIQSSLVAKSLPVPKAILGFALEVIAQKAAEKIRSYIETEAVLKSNPALKAGGPHEKK
jgi:uncharacterized membrane protein